MTDPRLPMERFWAEKRKEGEKGLDFVGVVIDLARNYLSIYSSYYHLLQIAVFYEDNT